MTHPRELRRRLARLDSCLLSDALDQLGLPGALTGLPCLGFARRIAGPVVTVGLAAVARKKTASSVHPAARTLEGAPRGAVIVVANEGRTEAAAWGGLLSIAARRRGLAGAIIDGAARDIEEARSLRFAVYARASSPRTARGRYVESSHNQPVRVGGLGVSPGDFVLADGTGVIFLRAAAAERVIEAAEQLQQREKAIQASLERGKPIAEALGMRYERLVRRQT